MGINLTHEDEVLNMENIKLPAALVHDTLRKHMLVDGFDFVIDLEKSQGSIIVDEKNGDNYIDFFTFFASSPLGMNHPKMMLPEVQKELLIAGTNKPSNSDIYTTLMAEFVDTFARIAKPDYMKYLFFISTGTLAIENGLKVAFDWKVRKNFAKGYKEERGQKVIHFKQAFHGRSGYTLSLTNTEPNKIKYFPKFDWPRITNPKSTFPVNENIRMIKELEAKAIDEINSAIKANKDDIAVLILEPIQGEGGDNFFRKEFHEKLRDITNENDILLMYDEVQTGVGITGKMWAHQHYTNPDIMAFGKKTNVCGIMVSDKIDEVEDHCFKVSSRINSTWGSDLVDMVRSKHFLRIIAEENLVENSRIMGNYLLENLLNLQAEFPDLICNTRGLGLMCSFDFADAKLRNQFKELCYNEKVLILGCGEKSIRFRPALNISQDILDKGLKVIKNVLYLMGTNI
jgi:L-lysine 6-transaminase